MFVHPARGDRKNIIIRRDLGFINRFITLMKKGISDCLLSEQQRKTLAENFIQGEDG
jgi:hypothetical protein